MPILADIKSANVSREMPTMIQDSSSPSFSSFSTDLLEVELYVQVMMTTVIIRMERYLDIVYCFPKIITPNSMFAIRLPALKIMWRGIGMLKLRA